MRKRSPLDSVEQTIREAKVFDNLYEETRLRSHRKWVDRFAQTMKRREEVYAAAPPGDHPRHEILFEERSYSSTGEEFHRSRSSTANSGYKESYRLMRSHRAKELLTVPGDIWLMTQSAGAFKNASSKGFETLTLPPIQPLHQYPENAGYPCGNGWVPIEQ